MIEIAILAGLILLNGVFAMSELAVVSASAPLLRMMAERDRPGAASAARLAEEPGRFLSTVQIGITLIGVGAGAFSGATMGGRLTALLDDAGVPSAIASPLGYGGVVVIVTYLSVVIGELVPKQFALRNAEAIACLVAPPMTVVSRIAAPVVWLLDASTRLVFRIFGMSATHEDKVSEDEIKSMVHEAAESGVIERAEKHMIASVLRLSDRRARGVMTPRTDVETVSLDEPFSRIQKTLAKVRHNRIPVSSGQPDNIVGVLVMREYLAKAPKAHKALRRLLHKPSVVPDTLGALDVLDVLRKADFPLVLVHDEYGHFEGVVTPADLLEAITGVFRSDVEEGEEEEVIRREDGSWLLPGNASIDDLGDRLDLVLPQDRDYQTLAGYIIDRLQRLPTTGESIEAEGWRLEIVDMDGRRIDKVIATPIDPVASA